jgi:Protein of unknown function (DUF559)
VSHVQSLYGVFVGSHAVAEGAATRRQLQSGLYRRLLRNVYADPSLPADHQLHARAAALLMPGDAALGGRSAAAWFGAPFAAATEPVLVLVPPGVAWRGPRGVRVHRTEFAPDDVLGLDDVRVTAPLRTAWDIATLESVPTAVGLLDGMVRAGHLTAAALLELTSTRRGTWGSARASTVAPLVDGRSESPPESWVRVAAVRAGLPAPVPQFDVVHAGEFVGRVDLAWPDERLIVEYEGAHHFEGLQIVRDDERYRRLTEAGWTVLRLSAADLRDMTTVVARIAEALGVPF